MAMPAAAGQGSPRRYPEFRLNIDMQTSTICVGAALGFAALLAPLAVVQAVPVPATGEHRAAETVLQRERGRSEVGDAFARQMMSSADHGSLPFAVIDKQSGWIAVYRADRSLAGESAVLIGQDPGDIASPGVGERTQQGRLRSGDRTTPAGRFVSESGRNLDGEAVVWIDYEAALAIHRLRPGAGNADRRRRLESVRGDDKRVSAGCVVVPVAFYQAVVGPVLGRGAAVIYILPEGN